MLSWWRGELTENILKESKWRSVIFNTFHISLFQPLIKPFKVHKKRKSDLIIYRVFTFYRFRTQLSVWRESVIVISSTVSNKKIGSRHPKRLPTWSSISIYFYVPTCWRGRRAAPRRVRSPRALGRARAPTRRCSHHSRNLLSGRRRFYHEF